MINDPRYKYTSLNVQRNINTIIVAHIFQMSALNPHIPNRTLFASIAQQVKCNNLINCIKIVELMQINLNFYGFTTYDQTLEAF